MASKKEELLQAVAAHKAIEARKTALSNEDFNLSRGTEAQSMSFEARQVRLLEIEIEQSTIQVELEAAWDKLQAAKAAYKAELLTPQVPPTPKPDRSRVKRLIQDFDDRIKGVDLTAEEFRALMVILLQRFHP